MFIKVKGAYDPTSINGEYCFDVIININHIICMAKKVKESAWQIILLGGTKLYINLEEAKKFTSISDLITDGHE